MFFPTWILLAALPTKQPDQLGQWSIWASYGDSQTVLGSEDHRRANLIGVQYSKPERKFRYRSYKGELVLEGYYLSSRGGGIDNVPPDRTDAFGALAMARYVFPRRIRSYLEAGWGLQLANRTTIDLSSRLNSTPVLGAGVILDAGTGQIYVGVRYLHISNGGTVGNNQGQNQLHLMLGYRF